MIFEELFYIKLCRKEKKMFHFEQIIEIRLLTAQAFKQRERVCKVSSEESQRRSLPANLDRSVSLMLSSFDSQKHRGTWEYWNHGSLGSSDLICTCSCSLNKGKDIFLV